MSAESYEASALAQADAICSRSSSIDTTQSDMSTESSPELDYQRKLFQHTNTQYLRAKDRLAKQSMRKSRAATTAKESTKSGDATETSTEGQ